MPNENLHPRVERESVPTREELQRVLLAASPAERVAIALVAFSGVRLQVLGTYDGSDGLRLSDFPELRIEGHRISFNKAPTRVRIRASLSKSSREYLTFLGDEGCRHLKEYLEARLRSGERIGPETDVITPVVAHKRHVTTTNVGDKIRHAMRAAGVAARPYAWRTYWRQRMLEAENAGRITKDFAEFFFGHTGDVTARHYTTGHPNLSESLVEQMRDAYRRCEPYLSIAGGRSERNVQAQMAKVMLLGLGYTEKELASVDLENLDMAVFQDLVNKKVGGGGTAKMRQQLVEATELPRFLAEGWTVVTAVNGHQVVVNPPAAV